MSKNISLSDAVSIHYEGKPCETFRSGRSFASMRDFFSRLTPGLYAWGDKYRFNLDHHRFSLTLPRPWYLGKTYPMTTDIDVRDVDGVKVPNWKIIELYSVYAAEHEAERCAKIAAKNKRLGYKFRDGPAPGSGFKHGVRKRHRPLLKNEMTAAQVLFADEIEELVPQPRTARSSKALSLTTWDHRGRGRRSKGWKEYRHKQWRE